MALLNGEPVGEVYHMGNGRLAFQYAEQWRESRHAYPLSLSMPLAARQHGDRAIRSYLWNLLPDNPDVLEWWARRYGVSRFRVVDLLEHVGEDVAGAVQFTVADRTAQLLGTANIADENLAVTWLSEQELEERLRDLRLNPAAGRAANDTGQFSLAGAQPKTALYQNKEGRWGIPTGRMPTNRILKPPTLGLDDLAYNEHLCMSLARELGLPAARSAVRMFGREVVIVVERYDREEVDGALIRVHQEDMCQAHGVLPGDKYESDGGPGIIAIAEMLRAFSTEPDQDVGRLVEACALNWLIGGTDAHAKNYSILHAKGPQLRLAPLYDLISVLPYPQLTHGKNKLAMAVGGERLISAIDSTHWLTLAKRIGMSGDEIIGRIIRLGERIPGALEAVNAGDTIDDESRTIVARLGAPIAQHAAHRLKAL